MRKGRDHRAGDVLKREVAEVAVEAVLPRELGIRRPRREVAPVGDEDIDQSIAIVVREGCAAFEISEGPEIRSRGAIDEVASSDVFEDPARPRPRSSLVVIDQEQVLQAITAPCSQSFEVTVDS